MRTVLGALIALVAAGTANYGFFLQKVALNRMPEIGSESIRHTLSIFFSNVTWLKGQGIAILGSILNNAAIALAPLSIVQPLSAAGVAVIVVLSITRLKEKARLIDWTGVFSIGAGIVLMGISLAGSTGGQTGYRPVLLWFLIILMVGLTGASLWAAFTRKKERTSSFLGIGVGMLSGLIAIFMKMAWTDVGARWQELKVASLVFSWYFWLAVLATLLSLVVFQVALQRGDAIVVVPLVTGFSNLVPVIVGFIAFQEKLPSNGILLLFRLLAIFLITFGAVILSLREDKDKAAERQLPEAA